MTAETQLHAGWGFIPFEYKWDELTKRLKISTQCPKAPSLFQTEKLHPQKVPRPKQHKAAEQGGKCSRCMRKVGHSGWDGFTCGLNCTAACCAISTWLWIAIENKLMDLACNLEPVLLGAGKWEHCTCSHHLSGRRRNLPLFPRQCLRTSPGLFQLTSSRMTGHQRPCEHQQLFSPLPADLMAQALLARAQSNKRPRDAAESVLFLHASCTL